MQVFDSGATRDSDDGKYDYEGFISPFVLEEFGKYMHKNRRQANGNLRNSDNWQKGIPRPRYLKSLLRHVFAAWRAHRQGRFSMDDWMGILFNAQGYVLEQLIADGQIQIKRPSQVGEDQTIQDDSSGSCPQRSGTIESTEDRCLETGDHVESYSLRIPSIPV